jgi:NitT/TauT family transport system permease protein
MSAAGDLRQRELPSLEERTEQETPAPAGRSRTLVLVRVTQVLIVVAVLGWWQLGTMWGVVDPFLWSRPADVWQRVITWLTDGTVMENLLVTLYEAAMAFLIGTVSGVVLGFLLGMTDFWSKVLHPFVSVINAIPRLVFAPIFFLIFGLGPDSKIAIAVSLIFFVVFFNAYQGVREVDPVVLDNARMLGAARRGQQVRFVLLPSALTWILASLQASVGFAMIGVIVGEYLGSARGLGYVIARSQGNLDTTGVMAGLIILSVVAVVVTVVIGRVERHLMRWKRAAR